MALANGFEPVPPTHEAVEALDEPLVIEFGTPWCGFCQAAQVFIADALGDYAHVRHLKVEDGPGQPLGRSFRVKLWPTLIFMRHGKEVDRVVRPTDAEVIRRALARCT